MIAILHLSDIHFRPGSNPVSTRVDSIAAAVRAHLQGPTCCFIVVTGDVAYSGHADEYAIAAQFFTSLRQKLSADLSIPIHLLLVPGNHDCNFHSPATLRDFIINHFSRDDVLTPDQELLTNCVSVQRDFLHFLHQLISDAPSETHPVYSEQDYSVGPTTIRFHLYNTAWISRLHELPGTMLYPVSIASTTNSASRPADLAVSRLAPSPKLAGAHQRSSSAHPSRTHVRHPPHRPRARRHSLLAFFRHRGHSHSCRGRRASRS